MGHKDLRLEKIVYILVFYNISFSWLLSLDGFQYIFLVRDSRVTVKTIYSVERGRVVGYGYRTIVRTTAVDTRVIWCIFSGCHP